jgi:outer membrane receptor protein involved in Fe transport
MGVSKMKNLFLHAGAACVLTCGVAVSAYAQPVSAASVVGVVMDSLGKPIAGAQVSLLAADGHAVSATESDAHGQFTIAHVAPGVYQLNARKKAFQPSVTIVTVGEKTGPRQKLVLASNEALEIQVSAKRLDQARNTISVETGSSSYHLDHKAIAALPQGDSTPINQVVLQAPGVAQDSFGQVHVRGDHGDLQYRINDIILPESISGFGQTLDTRFVQGVNLLTGALPAQYGYRTAGIVDIQTKGGTYTNGGDIGVTAGSNNTREVHGSVNGHEGKLNYYLTGSYLQNDMGIENPTSATDALHDHTTQDKGFGYFSYLLNDTQRVSVILGTAENKFQIPNTPDQSIQFTLDSCDPNCQSAYPSANIDENQREITHYGIVALQGTHGNAIDYQIAGFTRYSRVDYTPDTNADLLYTGVASQVLRTSQANGMQADISDKLNPHHTLRAGLFFSKEDLRNNNDLLAFPADASGNQTSTTPIAFTDNNSKSAYLYGVYLQDEWKPLKDLTINYGARYDKVDAYVTGDQLSPRLGAVYQISKGTTLHAGYARYFTPPPTELVTSTTISSSAGTTAAPPNTQNDPVQPETADYYDLGVSHVANPNLTLGLDGYYKKVTNLLDEGQFGSALLYTPFNYRDGKIYGLELTANYHKDNFSSYFNVARSTAMGKGIVSAQYNFDPGDLDYIANNWIHLDHDQQVTVSTGVSYLLDGTTYSADALYGSGLRKDENGIPNGGKLPGYTQVNMAVSHMFDSIQLGKVDVRLSVVNVFDKIYEIRDGSGVGVGAPQYGPRRAYYVSVDKYF